MSTEFTDLFEAFDQLVMQINADWMLYHALFEKAEHYPLFNHAGVFAWVRIRESLLDFVFMSIARLLDPAESCGRANLSLQRIMGLKADAISSDLKQKVAELEAEFRAKLKHWRNRRLSHNDLALALGEDALPEVEILHLESLVNRVNDCCRNLSVELRGIDVSYVPGVNAKRWVPGLIKVLKMGSSAL